MHSFYIISKYYCEVYLHTAEIIILIWFGKRRKWFEEKKSLHKVDLKRVNIFFQIDFHDLIMVSLSNASYKTEHNKI